MPKIRGGKSFLNTRTIDVPNPRKSKNATNALHKKLDHLRVFQEKEAQKIRNIFDDDNNDNNSNDDDFCKDDENYNDHYVDNDDNDYEDDNNNDVDNVDIDDEDENNDKDYSDDNDDVITVNNDKLIKKAPNPKSPHVKTHIVNEQHMKTAPTWAIQIREEIRSLRNEFHQFDSSFDEWKTMIQPLLDLLSSGDAPKAIPFQYVDDLENFERATEAEKMELVQFFKGFCTNNVQASCNEILINSIGPHEYITPFVTTEGKGSLHPPSLPPMIKTKFGECVKSALSLRSNKFPKPSSSDFKNIFDEALKSSKIEEGVWKKEEKFLPLTKQIKISDQKKDQLQLQPIIFRS